MFLHQIKKNCNYWLGAGRVDAELESGLILMRGCDYDY